MTTFVHPNTFLRDPKLLVSGHFVGAQGSHLDQYFNKKVLPVIPSRITGLCLHINDYFRTKIDFDAVAGPELGAVIPSFEAARLIEFYTEREIIHVTVEKDPKNDKEFVVTSGLDEYAKGRKFLLMEDVLTSGGSFKRAKAAIERAGGKVVYGATILNRGGNTAAELGVKELFSVLDLRLPSWDAETCPMCRTGTLINLELGHGAAFVETHGQPKAA